MDIDQGGAEGFVPHEILNGQQIRPILIEMGSKGMPERMAGDAVLPAEGILQFPHFPHNVKRIDGAGFVFRMREKPSIRSAGIKPVVCEDIQCFLGKNGITVRTVLGMRYMDPHIFTFDITVTEVTDFPYPEPGRVHEGDHGFGFYVRKRRDKKVGFFLSGDIGKIGIKLPHGELGRIPGFVQHIHGEEAELGDTMIDRTVRKGTPFLKPADKIPEFIPGNVFRLFMKDCLQVLQIGTDVSGIRFYSVVSKATQGDHLPVNIEIVHDGTSLKKCSNRSTGYWIFKAAVLEKDKICSC